MPAPATPPHEDDPDHMGPSWIWAPGDLDEPQPDTDQPA